jgi:hypothetical protein
MWLTLFCLVGLGPAIAIKVVAPPASLVVEPAQEQSKIEPAFALNESAKSYRLELPNVEAKIIVPATKTMPAEAPSTSSQIIKKTPSGHWQDANARISSVTSSGRYTKGTGSKKSAGKYPSNERAEVWHCRRDAVGSLLRSLDLSPRCTL